MVVSNLTPRRMPCLFNWLRLVPDWFQTGSRLVPDRFQTGLDQFYTILIDQLLPGKIIFCISLSILIQTETHTVLLNNEDAMKSSIISHFTIFVKDGDCIALTCED